MPDTFLFRGRLFHVLGDEHVRVGISWLRAGLELLPEGSLVEVLTNPDIERSLNECLTCPSQRPRSVCFQYWLGKTSCWRIVSNHGSQFVEVAVISSIFASRIPLKYHYLSEKIGCLFTNSNRKKMATQLSLFFLRALARARWRNMIDRQLKIVLRLPPHFRDN